jgi:hypothetical protein
MPLVEIIDYGPYTFGTNEESGGNSESTGEILRLRRKNSPKAPLPPHIARAKRAKRTKKKHQRRFFAEKNYFLRKSCVFSCLASKSLQSRFCFFPITFLCVNEMASELQQNTAPGPQHPRARESRFNKVQAASQQVPFFLQQSFFGIK